MMRHTGLFILFAIVVGFVAGCTYEPYAELSCSTSSDCGEGSSCVGGFCVAEPGPGDPARVTVTPTTLDLEVGEMGTVVAEVADSEGTIIPDAIVTWSSSDNAVATVADGTITGVGDGTATITATVGAASADVTVAVETPVASVVVDPMSVDVGVGISETITATALDADGNELDRPIIWISDDATIASVDSSGTITGVALGMTRVTATAGEITAEVSVTVSEATPASVEIRPDDGRVSISTGQTFEAVVLDDQSRVIDQSTLGATFTWSNTRTTWDANFSVPPQAWLINFSPTIEDEGMGTLSIEVDLGGGMMLNDSLELTAYVPEIVDVTTNPEAMASLNVGESIQITYVATDEDGNQDMLQTPMWSSSEPGVATVDADGNVEAVGPGTTSISLTVGEQTVMIEVTVAFVLDSIAAGKDHTCGLTPQNIAYCWGDNSKGELGVAGGQRSLPVRVNTPETFDQITAGNDVTCALTTGGAAYCWGHENRIGDDADAGDSDVPKPVAGGLTFTAIDAQFDTVCGLTAASEIYCWGQGGDGQIGDDNSTSVDVPTMVTKPGGTNGWKAVAVGDLHVCAVNDSDVLHCWGDNSESQLGDGTTTPSATPTPAMTSEVFDLLTLGGLASCGLNTAGAAYCWGDNSELQTGTGTATPVSTPTAVQGGITFSALDMGEAHACGINSANDQVVCWGEFTEGRLGYDTSDDSDMPTPTDPVLTAMSVDLGHDHSCAIDMNGTPRCWGSGNGGRIGGDSVSDSDTPQEVWPAP